LTTLFISDLHLDPARPEITEAFLTFLRQQAAAAETLYILGDLFEAWLGDDDDSTFNRQIIDALAALPARKWLMHGNRDFLMGDTFCRAINATLLSDPTVIDLYGTPALLMHGDSLCTRDQAYMAIRKVLRSSAFQADFLTKSIAERDAFAKGARQQSKAHTREAASDIMDVTPDEVPLVMKAHGVDLLIHGHTHRPAVHTLHIDALPAERIVLGDWDQRGWCLSVDRSGRHLQSFAI
jgi:UDP-2,3-diacylglucosamine hydrolase